MDPMLPLDLPPVVGPVHGPSIDALSAGARRTLRQRRQIAAGRHPATGLRLRPEGGTCGSCAHSARHHGGTRQYWKCGLVPHTFGPGTDIRVSWPACARWEER